MPIKFNFLGNGNSNYLKSIRTTILLETETATLEENTIRVVLVIHILEMETVTLAQINDRSIVVETVTAIFFWSVTLLTTMVFLISCVLCIPRPEKVTLGVDPKVTKKYLKSNEIFGESISKKGSAEVAM